MSYFESVDFLNLDTSYVLLYDDNFMCFKIVPKFVNTKTKHFTS